MTEEEKEENKTKTREEEKKEDTGSTFEMPSGARSKKKSASNLSAAQEQELIKVSYIFPNGDRYEGECAKSACGAIMRTGMGKHTSLNGIVYTGEWQEDKINGKGTLQLPSGAQYEGQFNDNMYHGTGTYTFPDGSTYKGQFCKNRLEGEGVFTNTQGLVWTGKFEGESATGLKMLHTI